MLTLDIQYLHGFINAGGVMLHQKFLLYSDTTLSICTMSQKYQIGMQQVHFSSTKWTKLVFG